MRDPDNHPAHGEVIPCGPDPERHLESFPQYVDARLRRGYSLLEPGPLVAQPVLEFLVGDLDVLQQYRRFDGRRKLG